MLLREGSLSSYASFKESAGQIVSAGVALVFAVPVVSAGNN